MFDVDGDRQILHLQNGGQLAFSEYGARQGMPVFFFHGWPSSRTMAELTHEAALSLNIRIVSPDRPGIRDSTLARNRTLLDWPPVLRELTTFLGINRFRILAISGGAPYAYASAWAMPESIAAVAVVSGAPPIAELRDRSGLLALYNRMLALYASRPQLLRLLFYIGRPFASMRLPRRIRPLLLKALQPCDAEVLRESRHFEACFESARQAWRSSVEGILVDAEVYARPWGFPIEAIRVPVRLWHGAKDRAFSFLLAEEIAARLADCRLRVIEDAGHYSLPIRHAEEILADLVGSGE
jgi:pimeloyl-ACP methyl ester carboxylesterase